MKRKVRIAFFVVCVSLVCIGVMNAAVFNVVEPNINRSTDLPLNPNHFGDPEGPDGLWWFEAFADIGTNRVNGSFNCTEVSCWDKGDSFKFVLPSGLIITEVSWIVNNPILRISGPSGTIIDSSVVGTGSLATNMEPGTYSVTLQNGTTYGVDNYGGPWEIRFECSSTCECYKANLDGQGRVDLGDMAILAAGWLKDATGDINEDGQTNMSDLEIFAHCWLSACGG